MRENLERYESMLSDPCACGVQVMTMQELANVMKELRLLRRLESAVTEYLNHSGRSKAWMSIDTLRQTVASIRKEINGE